MASVARVGVVAAPRPGWQRIARAQLRMLPRNVALLFIALWTLGPFVWTISTSLKGIRELYTETVSLIPRHPTLSNYEFMLIYMQDIPVYLRNSLVVTAGSVTLTVVLASLMGYAFARLRFRGRDVLFYTLLVVMFVPHTGGLIAAYELMYNLGLRNSLPGLVLYFSSALSVPLFIMRQTFLGIPRELEESAMIDGAGRWAIFSRIALPFGYGGMVVVAVLTFVHVWGDYLLTITMVDLQALYTVGVGVSMFYAGGAMVQDADISGPGIQSAGYLAAALPVMVTYFALQRYFVRGMTEGVLKQ
jgi:ABC-type glycerol-3-phosphate transport system permease component